MPYFLSPISYLLHPCSRQSERPMSTLNQSAKTERYSVPIPCRIKSCLMLFLCHKCYRDKITRSPLSRWTAITARCSRSTTSNWLLALSKLLWGLSQKQGLCVAHHKNGGSDSFCFISSKRKMRVCSWCTSQGFLIYA